MVASLAGEGKVGCHTRGCGKVWPRVRRSGLKPSFFVEAFAALKRRSSTSLLRVCEAPAPLRMAERWWRWQCRDVT